MIFADNTKSGLVFDRVDTGLLREGFHDVHLVVALDLEDDDEELDDDDFDDDTEDEDFDEDMDDDDEDAAPTITPKANTVSTVVPPEVDDLLAEWGAD